MLGSDFPTPFDLRGPVLVLGAGGRLGRMLCQYWPIDRDLICQSRQSGVGGLLFDPLKDRDALMKAAQGKRAVICLAGVVPRGPAEPSVDFAANSDLARVTVEAAKHAGCPRVFLASTAAIYGDQAGPLSESAQALPCGAYGQSKLRMEEEAHAIAGAFGQSVTSLRIANVAGADAILGGWHQGMQVDRMPDGSTPRRSYIGGASLAAMIFSLTRIPQVPPVLNLALAGAVEIGALLDAAGLPWTDRVAQKGVIPEVTLDMDLLGQVLGDPVPWVDPDKLIAEWRGGSNRRMRSI